jgi:lantibiotic modifying enzyme
MVELEGYLKERSLQFFLPSLATKCGVLGEAVLERLGNPFAPGTDYSESHVCDHLNFDSDRHIEKMAQSAISLSERAFLKAIDRLITIKGILQARCGIDITKIDTVQIPSGETHNGGAQPIIFGDKHVRIAYKPVDLRAQSLLRTLSQSLFKKEWLDFPGIPEVFYSDRHYGVMEYVQLSNHAISPTDYEMHYYKFGRLLALAHCFKVIDLHHENVFITQHGPVLLDLETMFYPLSPNGRHATVEDTMLIGHDAISGIDGGGMLSKIGVHAHHSENRFKIEYVRTIPRTDNRIVSSGNGCLVKPSKFKKHIIRGFSAGHDEILRTKDSLFPRVLATMKLNIACRYILRPTRYYAVKQLQCIQPKITATHRHLSTIKHRLLQDVPKPNRAIFDDLVDYEFSDLLSGDIPYFYTTSLSRHLYHRGRIAQKHFFAQSQFQALRDYFENISEKDKQEQIEIIDAALIRNAAPPRQASSESITV